MLESATRVFLPLQSRPMLHQAGTGTHGHLPVERFLLPKLWAIHCYPYWATLALKGQTFSIRPGCISVIPPGTPIEYRYRGRSRHVYAHFSFPGEAPAHQALPLFDYWGRDFAGLERQLQQVAAYADPSRNRAEAVLWNLLWQLSDRIPQETGDASHPAMEKACQIIETELSSPISIPHLAARTGFSHNHLSRLFREEKNSTIVEYIRKRRMQLARHLLVETTLPIKQVANQSGIPDLHLFNKTVRRELGGPPREIRRKALRAGVTRGKASDSRAGSGQGNAGKTARNAKRPRSRVRSQSP